jgi:hypothetical protein
MQALRALLIIFVMLSCTQAMDIKYHLGGLNNDASVIYHQEISSNMPTWINWTTYMEEGQGSIKIKPADSSYTYILMIVKVKV